MYTHMHSYTNSASGADRSSGSSGPGGVWRATSLSERRRLLWSGSWLWIPDAAPNPVSQPLLSSMVERGRTAEQISLCFSTLAKAAPANTHQYRRTWRQLTPFSLLQTEQLFFEKDMFCVCVCLPDWRTSCYQRKLIRIDDLWFCKSVF